MHKYHLECQPGIFCEIHYFKYPDDKKSRYCILFFVRNILLQKKSACEQSRHADFYKSVFFRLENFNEFYDKLECCIWRDSTWGTVCSVCEVIWNVELVF